MFGYYDHVIDPLTGRPEPDESWLRESMLIWTAFGVTFVLIICAAYDFARWGGQGRALELLGVAAVFGLLTFARYAELSSKRRAYRAALAEYEAALACSAQDLPGDPA
jgi:hypothetical protein